MPSVLVVVAVLLWLFPILTCRDHSPRRGLIDKGAALILANILQALECIYGASISYSLKLGAVGDRFNELLLTLGKGSGGHENVGRE